MPEISAAAPDLRGSITPCALSQTPARCASTVSQTHSLRAASPRSNGPSDSRAQDFEGAETLGGSEPTEQNVYMGSDADAIESDTEMPSTAVPRKPSKTVTRKRSISSVDEDEDAAADSEHSLPSKPPAKKRARGPSQSSTRRTTAPPPVSARGTRSHPPVDGLMPGIDKTLLRAR